MTVTFNQKMIGINCENHNGVSWELTISWGFKGLGQLDMGYELGPNQGFSPKMFQTPGSPTQKNTTSTQYDILITRG
jgi:hypothetical protein